MGLTISYFYSLTPRQFYNIQKGYYNRKEQEFEMQALLTRKIMLTNLLPWSGKGKTLNEHDLLPLSIDKNAIEADEVKTKADLEKERKENMEFWERVDARREAAKKSNM